MRRWGVFLMAVLLAGGLVLPAISLGRAAPGPEGGRPAPILQRGRDDSACVDSRTVNGTPVPLSMRELLPSQIRICDTSTVSMTLRVQCDEAPLHVMVDIDRSGSMVGQPIQDAKDAAIALVNALDVENHPETLVGLISHGDPPRRDARLTNNAAQIIGAIRRMSAGGGG